LKDVIVLYSGWLTFICFYQISKQLFDVGLARMILAALLCVGVASSLVSIVQFFFDPELLRFGSSELAFAGRLRSNGVFGEEYSHSYFLILGLAVALTSVKQRSPRILLVVLMLIGIALSFHRMSWIVTVLVLIIVSIFNAPSRGWRFLVWVLFGSSIVLVLAVVGTEYLYQSSELVSHRLMEDTLSGRFSIYDVVMERIPNVWLTGVGSVKSDFYYLDMTLGGAKQYATGEVGGIHNLYLNMTYLYGIPTSLLYTGFLITLTGFYWGRAHRQYLAYIAAIFATVFLCANLSNWFYPQRDLSLLLAVISGLAAGSASQESPSTHDANFFE
jgi:energy-coupling factor transporter transmembrane protein EcfT